MGINRPIAHPDPDISVVIPTVPENQYTPPDTLRNQTIDKYEVVVVCDGEINRCEARNKGMRASDSKIIAQTDDDCRPPKHWLERVKSHFETHPDSVLFSGKLDKHDAGPRHYIGANLAYRKKEALAIGGFDSKLAGWRADTDFGWRMESKYGAKNCAFDPDLEVVHVGPLRTQVDRELERIFRNRHPHRYFTYLYRPSGLLGSVLAGLMVMIYLISPRTGEMIIRIFTKIKSGEIQY